MAGWSGVKGGKWDNCNSIINKYILKRQSLESKAANFKFYALAMDDSTDAIDTAQLSIFIRGVDDEYNVPEEMTLVPLKDTTKRLI